MPLIFSRLVPLRLEVEEQVVSCLLRFMDKATESFSAGMKVDKLGPSKVPFWSFLRWNHINRSEQYAATALTFEVVQLSATQSRGIRYSKVVRRLEGYQCWAAAAAVEFVGGPQQKLPLLAKERPKAYIEILHINPIELTVRFVSYLILCTSTYCSTPEHLQTFWTLWFMSWIIPFVWQSSGTQKLEPYW